MGAPSKLTGLKLFGKTTNCRLTAETPDRRLMVVRGFPATVISLHLAAKTGLCLAVTVSVWPEQSRY
jgi:hypothetical protein